MIAVGIFMVGNALRMFNVHPFFRIFAIEPPKFITRYIRRKAKKGENFFSPLFLGALTVFIPCGVTQAMMAVAIGTGNAFQGAILMFAFILGTSPVFFTVAYLAMKLGARLEKWFMRFVAVVLLILGLVSVNSGLTLMGSPLSVTNIIQAAKAAQPDQAVNPSLPPSDGINLYVSAGNSGYSPRVVHAQAGSPITLNLVTNQTYLLLTVVCHSLPGSGKTLAIFWNREHFYSGTNCRHDHAFFMFHGHVHWRDRF